MRKPLKTALLGAVCLSTALGSLPPEALAGPMSVTPRDDVSLTSPVTTVHYRRWRHHHRHWRYGYYPRRHYWGYGGYYRPYYGYRYRPYYRYGYDPAGAMFAGAALGLMGAGIAAATAPRWGYGGWGYGGWGGPWGYGGGWGGPWGFGGGWGGPWGGWW